VAFIDKPEKRQRRFISKGIKFNVAREVLIYVTVNKKINVITPIIKISGRI